MNHVESPNISDRGVEDTLKAHGKAALRVTPEAMKENIVHTEIVKHVSPTGQVLRWAVLTVKNGFAVTGRPSAAISPENDIPELGEKLAIENAKNELWALMGYALKEKSQGEAQ